MPWSAKMHPSVIREATLPDAEAITRLLAELGYPTEQDVVERHLAPLLALSDSNRVLVALLQQTVVGFIAVHVIPLLHRPHPLGRITSLVVAEPARGFGIGRQLVAAGEAFLREHGCLHIEVSSAEHRLGAHAFYKELGYYEKRIRFFKEA
jgi:ribosomal protein S18 acetylase RimI-like enzyme